MSVDHSWCEVVLKEILRRYQGPNLWAWHKICFQPRETPILQQRTVTYFWCNALKGITEAATISENRTRQVSSNFLFKNLKICNLSYNSLKVKLNLS